MSERARSAAPAPRPRRPAASPHVPGIVARTGASPRPPALDVTSAPVGAGVHTGALHTPQTTSGSDASPSSVSGARRRSQALSARAREPLLILSQWFLWPDKNAARKAAEKEVARLRLECQNKQEQVQVRSLSVWKSVSRPLDFNKEGGNARGCAASKRASALDQPGSAQGRPRGQKVGRHRGRDMSRAVA